MQVLRADSAEAPLLGITSLCASSVSGPLATTTNSGDDDARSLDTDKKCWIATGSRDGAVHMWSGGGEARRGDRIVCV